MNKNCLKTIMFGGLMAISSFCLADTCSVVNPGSVAWSGTGGQDGAFVFTNNSGQTVSVQLQISNNKIDGPGIGNGKQFYVPSSQLAGGSAQLNVWNSATIPSTSAYCSEGFTTPYNSGTNLTAFPAAEKALVEEAK